MLKFRSWQRRNDACFKAYADYDVVIDPKLKLSYLDALRQFLISKGLKLGEFDSKAQYAPQVLILVSPDTEVCGGKAFCPGEDKAALWAWLRQNLPDLRSL